MSTPNSYHCICSTFILTTNHDLTTLPVRRDPALDQAVILPAYTQTDSNSPVTQHTILSGLVPDKRATVIRRDDGFERRVLLRCQRCDLVIGYRLDQAQFKEGDVQAQDILYVLPGSLLTTEDMMAEKVSVQPHWAQPRS